MRTPKIANRVWTPWGIAEDIREVIPGVQFVTTQKHGGLMIDKGMFLSEYAREVATDRDGVLFFEEHVLMNVAIIDLDLPKFDKERAINILANDHMEYLKLMNLDNRVTEENMKAALAHQAEMKRRSEQDPDLITAAVPLKNGGEWLAYTADRSHIYVCLGKKTSENVSDNTIVCCISSLIEKLGKKARFPIRTEAMGPDREEDFLSEVNEDEGGMLNVVSADPLKLKVELILTLDNKVKKTILLDANSHELIQQLVLEFSR